MPNFFCSIFSKNKNLFFWKICSFWRGQTALFETEPMKGTECWTIIWQLLPILEKKIESNSASQLWLNIIMMLKIELLKIVRPPWPRYKMVRNRKQPVANLNGKEIEVWSKRRQKLRKLAIAFQKCVNYIQFSIKYSPKNKENQYFRIFLFFFLVLKVLKTLGNKKDLDPHAVNDSKTENLNSPKVINSKELKIKKEVDFLSWINGIGNLF